MMERTEAISLAKNWNSSVLKTTLADTTEAIPLLRQWATECVAQGDALYDVRVDLVGMVAKSGEACFSFVLDGDKEITEREQSLRKLGDMFYEEAGYADSIADEMEG